MQLARNKIPKFQYSAYIEAKDRRQYLYELLLEHLHRNKFDSNAPYLSMNQINQLINQMDIATLKIKQLHEVYLYSTYQRYQSKNETKKKLQAIMNQQKKKVDVRAVAQWFYDNIQKSNIKPKQGNRQKTSSLVDNRTSMSKNKINMEKKPEWKLPPIRGTSSQKLTDQLKYLVQIFEEMEKQRQNSGLIPINLGSDENQLDLSPVNIPYDPQLYVLNNNLSKLKIKAQERLSRIIQLARDEPRIRQKLQDAIQKFQKTRIQANQKVGRMGAMKAQKRLLEKRKREQDKFKKLKLGEEEDLLKAAHLYSLLVGTQEKKHNHNLIF